jgi:hypothetical protein
VNGLAAAKDLTAEAPRGLDAQLEGYAWLPRMLNKARASLAGTAGSYLFGCPVDHTCMARLGIAPEHRDLAQLALTVERDIAGRRVRERDRNRHALEMIRSHDPRHELHRERASSERARFDAFGLEHGV